MNARSMGIDKGLECRAELACPFNGQPKVPTLEVWNVHLAMLGRADARDKWTSEVPSSSERTAARRRTLWTMERPNLFSFATSELSQDAFLCWMAALANHEDTDLQRVGRAFIAWLWNQATETSVDADCVRLISGPRRQVDHIDVLFEAQVHDEKVLFIIEDKTETSQHSGQLERYRDAVVDREHRVVPVYFKTGYHFGSDVAARRAGYAVVGLSAWVSFLSGQSARSDILTDYREYAIGLLRQRKDAFDSLRTAHGFSQFRHAFVQYEFVGMLAERCVEAIGDVAITRGANVGGTPWTHYRFVLFPGALHGGVTESIFHRLDRRKNDEGKLAYYLSTRQYAPVRGDPEARRRKLERLKEYKALFDAVVNETSACLRFAGAARDLKGANESEIGLLFFDDDVNSTMNVLEKFPAFHRRLVERISDLRGVTYGHAPEL